MIRIFHVISSINLGGAENVVFNLLEQCFKKYSSEFQFYVLEIYATDSAYAIELKSKLKKLNVTIITLGKGSKRLSLISAPVMLNFWIFKLKPDIIHSHTDLPDLVLSLVLRIRSLKNVSIVRTIHNTALWDSHTILGRFVEASFRNDSIVGVSKAALSAYVSLRSKYKLMPSKKTSVIYNGCNMPVKDAHTFEIEPNLINVAFCGRFVYQKGLDLLVKVLQKLNPTLQSKFRFHFVGDGELKPLVESLTIFCPNVYLYNPVNNLANKFYDFDYLIVPSRFEGLGLVSVESSLAKVPVIASNIPGLDETLPPDWPLLFDIHDENSLPQLLEQVAQEKLIKCNLSLECYTFVADRFSIEKMASSYTNLYFDLGNSTI